MQTMIVLLIFSSLFSVIVTRFQLQLAATTFLELASQKQEIELKSCVVSLIRIVTICLSVCMIVR